MEKRNLTDFQLMYYHNTYGRMKNGCVPLFISTHEINRNTWTPLLECTLFVVSRKHIDSVAEIDITHPFTFKHILILSA